MINRFELEKMVKKDIINEYIHLRNWHTRNSIPISKLEELMVLIDNEKINTHIDERHHVMIKVIRKLIDEAKS